MNDWMNIFMYVCMYMHVYVYMLVCVCVCVCVRGPFAKFVDSPYYSESNFVGMQ